MRLPSGCSHNTSQRRTLVSFEHRQHRSDLLDPAAAGTGSGSLVDDEACFDPVMLGSPWGRSALGLSQSLLIHFMSSRVTTLPPAPAHSDSARLGSNARRSHQVRLQKMLR